MTPRFSCILLISINFQFFDCKNSFLTGRAVVNLLRILHILNKSINATTWVFIMNKKTLVLVLVKNGSYTHKDQSLNKSTFYNCVTTCENCYSVTRFHKLYSNRKQTVQQLYTNLTATKTEGKIPRRWEITQQYLIRTKTPKPKR